MMEGSSRGRDRDDFVKITTICFVGDSTTRNPLLKDKINKAEYKVLEVSSLQDALKIPPENVLFILTDFDGDAFNNFRSGRQIMSSLALSQYLNGKDRPLRIKNSRQLFGFHLYKKTFCLKRSALRRGKSGQGTQSKLPHRPDEQTLHRYQNIIHYLGGTLMQDVASKSGKTSVVNFVIALDGVAIGEKFKMAANLGIAILKPEWLDFVWENRSLQGFEPTDQKILDEFSVKTFSGLYLAFVNFHPQELDEMVKETAKNGGIVVEPSDGRCTHIVVYSTEVVQFDWSTVPNLSGIHVVSSAWFWSSIVLSGSADEYKSDHLYPVKGAKNGTTTPSTRRRTRDSVPHNSSMMSFSIMSDTMCFSPLSVMDISMMSPAVLSKSHIEPEETTAFDPSTASRRRHVCMELLDTERNYLNILRTVVNVFFKPLEEKNEMEQPKYESLGLDTTEVKMIFGCIQPILTVHEDIYAELEKLIDHNWKEDNGIGLVFMKYADRLFTAYHPFITSFEVIKSSIDECDTKYPKFHAFLKMCESRPECKRQTFKELLINPVQRLPRYNLLFSDILKRTDATNPDHGHITNANKEISDILSRINEGKRTTDTWVMTLEVINDIEGGEQWLSAKRPFICKIDVRLLIDKNGNKHKNTFTLLLFNEFLLLCKKKKGLRRAESLKGSSTKSGASGSGKSYKRTYKYREGIELHTIRRIDRCDGENGLKNALVIQTEDKTDRCHKQYPVVLIEPDKERDDFMHQLKKYYCMQRINPIMETCDLTTVDFDSVIAVAENVKKGSFAERIQTGTAKISRTFSMSRRLSNSSTNICLPPSLPSQATNSNLNQGMAPTPSPRRMSTFRNLLAHPLVSSIGKSPLTRRQISVSSLCINNSQFLSDNNVGYRDDDNFSLPATPAPKKKKCPTATPGL